MKAEILKIAGVKSEKEFYNKYPTEEAFMKAHKKEFKKAKLSKAIPDAQWGCKGKSRTMTGDGVKKIGVRDQPSDAGVGDGTYVPLSNAPVTWEELQKYNDINPKDKDFKKRLKSLQAQFPNLTAEQLLSAGADSSRIGRVMVNPLTGKSDVPNWDKQKTPYDRAWFDFYRSMMDQPTKVTIPQILERQSQQPGGLPAYKKTVEGNYGRTKAEKGRQVNKFEQLTDFGNPPIAQDGYISPIGSYLQSGGQESEVLRNFIDDYIESQQDVMPESKTNETPQASAKDSGNGLGDVIGGVLTGIAGNKKKKVKTKKPITEVSDKTSAGSSYESSMDMGIPTRGSDIAKRGKKVPKYQFSDTPVPLGGFTGNTFDWSAGMGGPLSGGASGTPTLPGGNAAGMFQLDRNQTGTLQDQIAGSVGAIKPMSGFSRFMSNMGGAQGVGNILSSAIGIGRQIKDYKNKKKEAQTAIDVAKVVNQAARLPQERITRKYTRPEDYAFEPNQMFPTYGVGTNYLSRNGSVIKAQDGRSIGGNPTEIQNMYNPGDIYSDLGYEPMGESDIVKQYQQGGFMPMAQDGYSGSDSLGNFLGTFMGGNAGGGLGKAGTLGGAVAPALAFASFAIGDIQKRNLANMANQAKQLNESTMLMNAGRGLHGQYSQFMKDGGWVSHDWQPQTITKFGEYDVDDLLQRDPMMDTLRTGGRITQNNMFPQDQYALGGELKTTWGGHAETISHNPYMPGSGETVMFRGKSHDESDGKGHTGIGVKYGDETHDSYTDYAEYGTENADADVEVERGEPATEMIDAKTGEKNMVVFGNLKIPNQFLSEIGDPNAKGKKFKNYVALLGKVEAKQNKKIEKATNELDELNIYTPFDKLKFDSLKATIKGANMNLKDIAVKKSNAAAVQNAINDTAEEFGIDADPLAKGKIKIDKEAMKEQAKWGKAISKAQDGTYSVIGGPGNIDYNPIGDAGNDELWGSTENYEKNWKPKVEEALSDPERAKQIIAELESYTGQDAKDVIAAIKKQKTLSGKIAKIQELGTDRKIGPYHNLLNQTIENTQPIVPRSKPRKPISFVVSPTATEDEPTKMTQPAKKKGFDWMSIVNQALPFLRPTDQEPFDQSQLYPELYALSTNKVEPVQAQLYRPELGTPYDISLQDQMNANQADFNAIQRQQGYNPEALATLAAQKYKANSSVLGEQFRLNQAEKQRVYEGNRAVLNDAQLKNLGILDTQFVRQETAKSRTKDVAQAAISSMADKIAKNKLENRTLGIYENLYNYRFDKSGRAVNWNPFYTFDTSVEGAASRTGGLAPLPEGYEYVYNSSGKPVIIKSDTAIPTLATQPISGRRTGGNVKKTSKNGSIVKAIKNL